MPPVPKVIENTPYDQLHQSILAGIPRHIAHYVPEEQYFLGTGGKKFLIFPGSGLAKKKPVPAWLLSFALVETSRLFARQNAEIKPEYLEIAAPHLCSKIYDLPKWDPESGFVYARERLTFGGAADPQRAARSLCEEPSGRGARNLHPRSAGDRRTEPPRNLG